MGSTGRKISRLALVLAALATIGCDRVTKHVATLILAGQPDRSFLGDMLRVGYAENAGGFLSLGAGLPPAGRVALFTIATGLVLVAMVVLAIRRRWDGWPLLGVTLFLAGGVSNWIDRIVHGTVVDFLNLGIGFVRTGVFNVADVAIMLGCTIFILGELRKGREPATS